jgi:hypothetical protein
MHPITSASGVAVAFVCAVVVVARAGAAPSPVPRRPATPTERREIALSVLANEAGWQDESAKGFPEDSWSQSDDFHGREAKYFRELSDKWGVRVEDILRAVDDDVHAKKAIANTPESRRAHAVPCKPRPFYD